MECTRWNKLLMEKFKLTYVKSEKTKLSNYYWCNFLKLLINLPKLFILKVSWSLVFSNLTENLVPNIFLELFFVMQLLTSRSTHTHDDNEQEGQCAANSGWKVLMSSAHIRKCLHSNPLWPSSPCFLQMSLRGVTWDKYTTVCILQLRFLKVNFCEFLFFFFFCSCPELWV